MTHRARPSRTFARLVLSAVLAASFTGCEKKKPPPPPPPPPPPAPVIPDKLDVQALLQEMNSDARIQFPEDNAPTDRALAEGVIRLANALAKGDAGAMRGLLDRAGQTVLDELTGAGDWETATKKIEAVRIVRLRQDGYDRPTAIVATAIQDPDGAYVLVWKAQPTDDAYVFSPALSASGVKARASEWDSATVEASLTLRPTEPEEEAGDSGQPGTPPGPGGGGGGGGGTGGG